MNHMQFWPEPVISVQHLSKTGITRIPSSYVKNPSDRPGSVDADRNAVNPPVIDMQQLHSDDLSLGREAVELIGEACRNWGFFQVVNHGVSHDLMARATNAWLEFFDLPLEEKAKFGNSPVTYEGYGSRLGVDKGILLDWCDYFFLNYLPLEMRDENKWPSLPLSCRELVGEYSKEMVKLGGKLMKIFSKNLGLEENYLQQAFGGEGMSACMRVNYYPKCPQPELALGLSSHSDPGGLTLLLPHEAVSSLQVRHAGRWITVNPVANAFVVNLGDQLQVVSNGKYRSVEHRVTVNSMEERMSLAFFYNPRGDLLLKPAAPLVSDAPPLYPAMTFDEYRLHIRTKGPTGKSQVEALLKSNP